jgi:hypothetical protein
MTTTRRRAMAIAMRASSVKGCLVLMASPLLNYSIVLVRIQ